MCDRLLSSNRHVSLENNDPQGRCFLLYSIYHARVNTIFLALGSNMGNRPDNLRRALEALLPEVTIEKKSKVYESEPMYVTQQPRFYNMVVSGKTQLAPHDLLAHVKEIEKALGRLPDTHNQPRPIDIDILLYEDMILETPELSIPHPRMHERGFVMMPLEEIASFHLHPALRRPIIDLWDDIADQSQYIWLANEQL